MTAFGCSVFFRLAQSFCCLYRLCLEFTVKKMKIFFFIQKRKINHSIVTVSFYFVKQRGK